MTEYLSSYEPGSSFLKTPGMIVRGRGSQVKRWSLYDLLNAHCCWWMVGHRPLATATLFEPTAGFVPGGELNTRAAWYGVCWTAL